MNFRTSFQAGVNQGMVHRDLRAQACGFRAARHARRPMKILLALALATATAITAHAATTAADAFASIKKLQGEWRGPAMMKGMPPSHSIYRVTAGGSAVEETIFPGTKMEM